MVAGVQGELRHCTLGPVGGQLQRCYSRIVLMLCTELDRLVPAVPINRARVMTGLTAMGGIFMWRVIFASFALVLLLNIPLVDDAQAQQPCNILFDPHHGEMCRMPDGTMCELLHPNPDAPYIDARCFRKTGQPAGASKRAKSRKTAAVKSRTKSRAKRRAQ